MKPTVADHFQFHDPRLFNLWHKVIEADPKPIEVVARPSTSYFSDLVESVVSQQLSIKAADTIWGRVKTLLPNQEVTPLAILDVSPEKLRSAGLSAAKAQYTKNIALAVRTHQVDLDALAEMPEEAAIDQLVQIKGVGRWTAEMFLMFTLGREDVFSVGDLGLRRAIERWYRVPADGRDTTVYLHLSREWEPYRTYAARILWRSLTLPPTITAEML